MQKNIIRMLVASILSLVLMSAFGSSVTLKKINKISNIPLKTDFPNAMQQRIIQTFLHKPIPIPNGTGNFKNIESAALQANDKNFAFVGIGSANQYGLYQVKNHRITVIANRHIMIPGGAGYFTKINTMKYDPITNNLAFVGSGVLSQSGVYVYKGSKLLKIADQQTIVGKLKDLFQTFYNISIYNNVVLFTAEGQSSGKGLYVFYDGYIYKLVIAGDTVNKQKVQSISINHQSLQKNKVTFFISFFDGTSGTYQSYLSFSAYN